MIMFRNMKKRVEMTGIHEIFNEKPVEMISIFVRPQQCHSNAQ